MFPSHDRRVGSFRAAAEAVGPRIITFTVNGTINLESRIEIQSDCIIDGSTAPGLGVCIAGHRVEFRGTNICIRYLRFRLGISPFVTPKSSNPLIFTDDGIIPTDIVIDHCSVSWSRDTNIGSFNGAVDEDSASGLLAPRFRRISIQYCIISHPLRDAGHPDGLHARNHMINAGMTEVSVHHCLYIAGEQRNPQAKGGTIEFYNNVIAGSYGGS